MIDEGKRTIVQSAFANQSAFRTTRMEPPGDMTGPLDLQRAESVVCGPEEISCAGFAGATRAAKPRSAKASSAPVSLQTRMVRVGVAERAVPPHFFQGPSCPSALSPVLPLPPPPKASRVASLARSMARLGWLGPIGKRGLFVGSALLLGVCLSFVFSDAQDPTSKKGSYASPAPMIHLEKTEDPQVHFTSADLSAEKALAAKKIDQKEVSASAPSSSPSRAGALFLEGRRKEALAMYRELAEAESEDLGIGAMVQVLAARGEVQ